MLKVSLCYSWVLSLLQNEDFAILLKTEVAEPKASGDCLLN